uniref:Fatty acyl-CoA reductase n=1 Tax=Culicoides sonorensis TaxID=179676 RepID=A0A336LMI6_CULSO
MESPIVDFYRDKTILLTGFSGFLGQIVVEKLLRCCEVKVIYVLIRNKKGKTWQSRIHQIFKDPLFDVIRKQKPDFSEKVVGIVGDCCLPNFGLNQEDLENLKNKVNIVFHVAGLVNFDAKLSSAITTNVKGTHQHAFTCQRRILTATNLVVSCILATAWDIGRNSYQSTPIYNFVTKRSNSLTWGQFIDDNLAAARTFPTSKCYWYYAFDTTEDLSTAKMLHFLYHTIPAYIVDFALILMGQKFRLSRLYKVIYRLNFVLECFVFNEWIWEDNNVVELWKKMNPVDQAMFFFNMEKLEWQSYLYKSLRGMRLYIAKDDPSTIPYGVKRQKVLKIIHYAVTYTIKGIGVFLLVLLQT